MISITNPTGRKTECRTVTINGVTLCFSYETLIGFIDSDGTRHRVANSWGPTTGRHFNECGLRPGHDVDFKHWHYEHDKLQRLAMDAIAKDIALETEILNDCFNQKEN